MKFVVKVWGAWLCCAAVIVVPYAASNFSCQGHWLCKWEAIIAMVCLLLASFGAAVGATLTYFFAGRAAPRARTRDEAWQERAEE